MRDREIIVLGSGVIGVTTAYYLARAGHEVTVVDRQAGARKPALPMPAKFRRLFLAWAGPACR